MRLFKRKPKPLNTTILKQYRFDAYGKLTFSGGWSGYWTTRIDGINYRSPTVSGLKFLKDEYDNFIQDAILDRIKLRRNPEHYSKDLAMAHYGGYRYISENGNVEQWNW